MQLKQLTPLALAQAVAAQSSNSSRSLTDALNSQNASLSTLNSLLASVPNVVNTLNSIQNITILAPNNDALNKLIASAGSGVASNTDLVTALLSYHVINGTYYAADLTSSGTPIFAPTILTNQSYTNVTGGQRVEVVSSNGGVSILSGSGTNSTVVTPNVNFTGGTIHIIDTVLTIPPNDTSALISSNLTALAGALTQANLVPTVSNLKDVTIFAPNNDAFNAIGNLVPNITADQLSNILQYHVVPGRVIYSTAIQNGTAQAANKGQLTFTVENGNVFVNSAKVVQANVLVANGVVHVIDNVLNPSNTTVTPNPTASTQSPAYSGATSTTGVPFTSGVQTPTSTTGGGSGGTRTSSSSGLGVPMKTGAVGAAALFGGAALLVNM